MSASSGSRIAERMGERARHHVAHHVATGAERGQQRRVDPADELSQLALVDHVVLHALAGGEAQLVVGERRHPVEREPLVVGDHAAGHRGADHARVVERQLELCARPADVAVVLLIDPVELQQQLGVVVEIVTVVGELLADGAAEVVAGELDGFGVGAHRCNPHSVLALSAQRPARWSSPSATGRVHGQQPIDG
jgi:hypothetical protein